MRGVSVGKGFGIGDDLLRASELYLPGRRLDDMPIDRRTATPLPLLAAGLVVTLASCGSLLIPDPGGAPRGRAVDEPIAPIDRPPPVTVRAGDRQVDLEAWTYCYGNGCIDGSAPQPPADLGAAPQIDVAFPLAGWTFTAEFVPVGEVCPRRQQVAVEQIGDHAHVLQPAGHAGTYDVTLFGRGKGDLFVTFRWTTPGDGPMPIPRGRLAVLADHDGAVDSYGVELELADLAATPKEAAASITVTATDGEALTFDAIRAPGCLAEGTIYWDGPDAPGLQAVALGPPPFRYDVIVTLDGIDHVATAVWPDDQIEGNEPSVELDFDPPLPALR